MSGINNITVRQFQLAYPTGAYCYGLLWSSDKIKPSHLVYPCELFVDCELGSRVPNCFYIRDIKTKNVQRLGNFAYRIDYASSDLERVKEYFKNAVKRAAENRLTWLTEQATKTDQTAQSMYKKADKI